MEEHDNMDYFYQQVLQKDVTRRLQVGQDLIDYLNDPHRSPDVEQDKPRLDKTIDELTGWVNSSNFKVRDLSLLLHKGIAVSLQHDCEMTPPPQFFPRTPEERVVMKLHDILPSNQLWCTSMKQH